MSLLLLGKKVEETPALAPAWAGMREGYTQLPGRRQNAQLAALALMASEHDWPVEPASSESAVAPAAQVAGHLAAAAPNRRAIPPVLPPGTVIEAPASRDSRKAREAAPAGDRSAEDPAHYGVAPVEARPRRADRRAEIPVFQITRRGRGKPIPHWLDLAAGPGRELERCKEYLYFRELPDWQGVHSATIVGESMLDSLNPGDVVLLRALWGDTGLVLPALERNADKTPLQRARLELHDGGIYVLQLNDEPPTLKRIYLQGAGADWHLRIAADNPLCDWGHGGEVITRRSDRVIFWALLFGRTG